MKDLMQKAIDDPTPTPLPTVDMLRASLVASEGSGTRKLIASLFDDGTFSEIGVYTMRRFSEYALDGNELSPEGVICGYGAVDGRLVYAFGQDISRMDGAVDEKHAKKIVELYDMALQNGAPIVGVFNSAGADVYEGVSALAAYGRIMRKVSEASGRIPQIALVTGPCTGASALLASMFDFTVTVQGVPFYVHDKNGTEGNAQVSAFLAKDVKDAARDARVLLAYLPSRASDSILQTATADSINRAIGRLDFEGDLSRLIRALADNGVAQEITREYCPEILTAFTFLGGIRCGVIGNRFVGEHHKIDAAAARKASRFVSFCDAFSLPIITFVDSDGFADVGKHGVSSYASDLASLAFAYGGSVVPKITVILGAAIGGAFTVLGSKAMGADVVYALESAEISALPADAAVAFAWNNRVALTEESRLSTDEEPEDTSNLPPIDTNRDTLEEKWRNSLASPVAAACRGEIDDIIKPEEMRQKILSSLYMLAGKGVCGARRHPILPL